MTPRSKTVLIGLGATILLLVFFVRGCDHITEETLALSPPLENVTIHTFASLEWVARPTQRIGIHLRQQSEINQLLDLRVFGDFQPEMTDEDVVSRFGNPSQRSTDKFGGTWSRYSTPLGYVEIGLDRRTSVSGDDDSRTPLPGRRSLRAYTDRPLSEIFRPSLLDVIRRAEKIAPRAESREIDFFNPEDRLAMDISIKEGQIVRLELFRHVDR